MELNPIPTDTTIVIISRFIEFLKSKEGGR